MHIRELLKRICRNTSCRELDLAPVEVLEELLDAANEAIVEVSARLPQEPKSVPWVTNLRAPTSIEVNPTSGATTLGMALPAWLGCAVLLPGDATGNRLVAEDTLDRSHGGTTGFGTGMAWHDAAELPERTTIVGGLLTLEMSGQQSQLTQWNGDAPLWAQMTVSPGVPLYYSVRSVGYTSGDPENAQPPGVWLHVLPWPAAVCTLRGTVNKMGGKMGIRDFRRNSLVEVPSAAEPALIRLAEEAIMDTRLFVGDEKLERRVRKAALRAREGLELATTTHVAHPAPARLGSPRGW